MLRNWTICTLLIVMQNRATILENSLTVSFKTKHVLTNCNFGYLSQRNENLHSRTIFSNANHYSQTLRQSKFPSINEWQEWSTHGAE